MRSKLMALILAMFFMLPFTQDVNAGFEKKEPTVIALKFYADWCGTCQKMGPLLQNLSQLLDTEDVLFHQFDFTNSVTKRQAELMAGAMGLDNVLEENSATGFILLVDYETKKASVKEILDNLP